MKAVNAAHGKFMRNEHWTEERREEQHQAMIGNSYRSGKTANATTRANPSRARLGNTNGRGNKGISHGLGVLKQDNPSPATKTKREYDRAFYHAKKDGSWKPKIEVMVGWTKEEIKILLEALRTYDGPQYDRYLWILKNTGGLECFTTRHLLDKVQQLKRDHPDLFQDLVVQGKL